MKSSLQLLTVSLLALLFGSATPARAAGPLWVTKLVHEIPRTDDECAAAHAASKSSCIQVPAGDPHELTGFAGETTYEVTVKEDGQAVPKKLAYDFDRLNILSIGLKLRPEDEPLLPSVSKGRILGKVGLNYILIQLRVHRDREHGNIYFYYKPFAAVGNYATPGEAQNFEPLMEDSVRETRGLGLWCQAGTKPSAEQMRTFVALNKDTMRHQLDGGAHEDKTDYELVLARLRVVGDRPEVHTFVSADDRKQLHYMQPARPPAETAGCSLAHTIFFTQYTAAKQSPSAKVTFHVDINSRGGATMEELDQYAASAGWTGDAFDNLSDTLDALIDGKIKLSLPAQTLPPRK